MLTGSLEYCFGVGVTLGLDRSIDVGLGEEGRLMEIMAAHGVGFR